MSDEKKWPPRRVVRAKFANSEMVTGSMYRADLDLNKNIEWVEYLSLPEHTAVVDDLKRRLDEAVKLMTRWREDTEDGCMCGYFEEAVSEENEDGFATCDLCRVDAFLTAQKKDAAPRGDGK